MTAPLAGTVAVVTGASSGIGEATADALARGGAAVVIAARRRDRLEGLSTRITEHGGRSLLVECDVTDEKQARDSSIVPSGARRLDILVNNAGVMLLGQVEGADTGSGGRCSTSTSPR